MESILVYLPLLIAAGLIIFYFIRRSDYKVPKEAADVRIKSITEQSGAYLFTLDIAGEEKIFKTKESYFSRLKPGQKGRLAYRGTELLDFEAYDSVR